MASDLRNRHCAPCPPGTPALRGPELASWTAELPGWEVVDQHHLRREYRFPDFLTALSFVNRIAEVAEAEQHHPDLTLSWGRVVVETYTHSIGGLSANDFILAARIEALPRPA